MPETKNSITFSSDPSCSICISGECYICDDNGCRVIESGQPIHRPVKIALNLPSLSYLRLTGFGGATVEDAGTTPLTLIVKGLGTIRIRNINRSDLTLYVEESGDIYANGKAEKVKATVSGSGNIHAFSLDARHVYAHVSGSGDLRVSAEETLEARVSGSGDIAYKGNPRLSKRISGSGDIKKVR